MWSKQYWFAKAANSFDENGGPLSVTTVCGIPYSLNTCFRVSVVEFALVLRLVLYFSDHRKPTVVVCYQEIGSTLKLEEIDS